MMLVPGRDYWRLIIIIIINIKGESLGERTTAIHLRLEIRTCFLKKVLRF